MFKNYITSGIVFAAAGGTAGKKPGPRVAPQIGAISTDVPMPVKASTRGSKTEYPFNQLTAVGMSFPVFNKDARQLSSIVSNQNRKPGPIVLNADGTQKAKMIESRDASGTLVGSVQMKDSKGKPVFETDEANKPKYQAFDAEPNDPAHNKEQKLKVKARVFRVQ